MLNKSFKSKIILPTIIVTFLLVVALTVYSAANFRSYSLDVITEDLQTSANSIKIQLNNMENATRVHAMTEATNLQVIEAVKNRDTAELLRILTPIAEGAGIDYFTVSDGEGNVLARTHEPSNYGDSVANQRNVANALAGNISTFYESGTAVKVAVRSGAPIFDENGILIGAVSAGVRFDDDAFVDYIKGMYGTEVTIFLGDTRITTTIYNNGERVVGTKIEPEIASIVLDGRNEHFGETNVLGVPYKAFYYPLVNADNQVFAIIFLGRSETEIYEVSNQFIINSTIIGFVGLIAAVGILLFVITKISKPILNLSRDMENVAEGNMSINTQASTQDEIGRLNEAVKKVVGIVRELISDINIMVDEREKGDTDYYINAEKFKGEYRLLAENILQLIKTASKENEMLLDILNEFNNGNFNLDIPQQPGKKAAINRRVDQMKDNMLSLSKEIIELTNQAKSGNLSARADSSIFKGDWQTIIEGLNELIMNIAEPFNEINDVMSYVAAGNFDELVKGDYKGEYGELKKSINNTVTNIASYIDEISLVLVNMANDDLDQEIKREYVGKFTSIKEALTNIVLKFNRVITEIYTAADQVSTGAKQIAESSMHLSQGATQQASAVEELNSMIQSINEQTSQNAENAKQAESLSENSSENATKGNKDMGQMLESMNGIKESSNKISNIIKVIEDIAFQTNLLALNAAVEAARAGDHGKGFSVVAEEVRSLAAKSQDSAKDTTELIEESINRVSAGTSTAGKTADALNTIVKDANKIATIITGIRKASDEQNTALDQIIEGVDQIMEVVQINSATSEESAAAAQELASQADVLKSLVSVFKTKNY